MLEFTGEGPASDFYHEAVQRVWFVHSLGPKEQAGLGPSALTLTGSAEGDAEAFERLQREALEEIAKLASAPPTDEELQRVKSSIETGVLSGLETVLGKAEQLNHYLYYTGDPDHVAKDLAQYRALTPADIQRAAREYLDGKNRIVISIVPTGATELAAKEAKP